MTELVPVDHAEERPDRAGHPLGHPGPQLAPAPVVHADPAPASALTLADEQGTAGGLEVANAPGRRAFKGRSMVTEASTFYD